jgi:hypothetical protein
MGVLHIEGASALDTEGRRVRMEYRDDPEPVAGIPEDLLLGYR